MFLFLLLGLLIASLKLSSVIILQSLECLDMKIHLYSQVDGFVMLKYSVFIFFSALSSRNYFGVMTIHPQHWMMVLPMSQIRTQVHAFCVTCSLLTPLQRDIRLEPGLEFFMSSGRRQLGTGVRWQMLPIEASRCRTETFICAEYLVQRPGFR